MSTTVRNVGAVLLAIVVACGGTTTRGSDAAPLSDAGSDRPAQVAPRGETCVSYSNRVDAWAGRGGEIARRHGAIASEAAETLDLQAAGDAFLLLNLDAEDLLADFRAAPASPSDFGDFDRYFGAGLAAVVDAVDLAQQGARVLSTNVLDDRGIDLLNQSTTRMQDGTALVLRAIDEQPASC